MTRSRCRAQPAESGSVVVQLLRTKGATVLGIASSPHHEWLVAHGVIPISYGDGLAERLRAAAPNGIDAFIDLFGPQYVQLAVDLGVANDRIETIISREKAQELGTKSRGKWGRVHDRRVVADGRARRVRARSRFRSPRRIHSKRSATLSPSSSSGTRTARSC